MDIIERAKAHLKEAPPAVLGDEAYRYDEDNIIEGLLDELSRRPLRFTSDPHQIAGQIQLCPDVAGGDVTGYPTSALKRVNDTWGE